MQPTVIDSMRPSGDDELDEAVTKATENEVADGWLTGLWTRNSYCKYHTSLGALSSIKAHPSSPPDAALLASTVACKSPPERSRN